MSWTIYWSDEAEQELDRLLSTAPDPMLIAIASGQVDQELGSDPEEAGESRTESTRVLFCLPLVAFFVVHPEQSAVQVIHVRAAWKRYQR